MTDDTDNPGSKSRPVETTEGAWEEYKATPECRTREDG
jgi:hypothetical protein